MKESITMQDWLKTWERPVKKSSLKTYKSYERAHIIPFWGQIHLDEITGADLKKFKNFLSKKLAGKTVQDILSYLNTILQDAEKQGHLVRPELPKVKVPQREKEILDYREHKRLSQWLRQSTSPKDVGILLALSTGMRLGDADGKISLNQQKPSKHAGLRRFGPEKFLQRNNEFMKERPIFYKKPIKTEKDFSTWLRCFYYTTKAVITEYIYF